VIVHKLKKIAKHFKPGRQEDAHEFMRYLVDGVHEVCLRGFEKKDIHTQRTTRVYVSCTTRRRTPPPPLRPSRELRGLRRLHPGTVRLTTRTHAAAVAAFLIPLSRTLQVLCVWWVSSKHHHVHPLRA
jgi:hypothetical protein